MKEVAAVMLFGAPAPNYSSVAFKSMRLRLEYQGEGEDGTKQGPVQHQLFASDGRVLAFRDWEQQSNAFSVVQAAGRAVRGPSGEAAYHAGCLVMLGDKFLQMQHLLPVRLTATWQEVDLRRLEAKVKVRHRWC